MLNVDLQTSIKEKEIANKLINKFLSYQDHNKLINNLLALDPRYQNKQVMNTDTGYHSETWQCSSTHNNMTPSFLQRFSLFQLKIATTLQSNSNQLGKEETMLYLQQKLKPYPRGVHTSIKERLKLTEIQSKLDLSLTECN